MIASTTEAPAKIWVQESYVNTGTYQADGTLDDSQQWRFGDSDVYETWASVDQRGDLFRSLQREYGRCISTMMIDDKDAPGGARAIGWVFEKRMAYEDDRRKFYKREVWVSLHSAPPTKTTTYHYLSAE
jgi:hypothetical protein